MKNGWKKVHRYWKRLLISWMIMGMLSGVLTGCAEKKNSQEELEELTLGTDVEESPAVSEEREKDSTQDSEENQKRTSGVRKEGEFQKIYVHVCGAVNAPGVYELKENARVYEALEAAGGMTESAAADWINQAEPVTDGEKIYVLTREEAENSAQSIPGQEGTSSDSEGNNSVSKKVNINTAGKEELMTLTGIGESKAQSIMSYRQEHGSFQNIEELKQIEGIKDGVFNKIKEDITV